jgi:hypothetical protein
MSVMVGDDSAGGLGVRRWNYEGKLQRIDVESLWLRWAYVRGMFSRAHGHASKNALADTWDGPSDALSRLLEGSQLLSANNNSSHI